MDAINAIKGMGVFSVLLGAAVLVLCLVLSRYLLKLFGAFLKRAQKIDASLHSMMQTVLHFILSFISIMIAASVAGLPISSFLAVFSVAGLAISLAVQGILSNFAGGVIILASKPFSLGDYVEAEQVSGTVKEIGFLHTKMLSPDGKNIFVPNNLLYTSRLVNYTSGGSRRIDLSVSASYDAAPEQVRAACLDAAKGIKEILPDPAPTVTLEGYGDSAIQYTVRAWVASGDYLAAKYALSEALYGAFKAHGVEMTYPHVNVHMQ